MLLDSSVVVVVCRMVVGGKILFMNGITYTYGIFKGS